MSADFPWWLLIVGLVAGALLVFLVMAEFTRSADEQADAELVQEARWISSQFAGTDRAVEPAVVEDILRLNRDWLAGPALQANEVVLAPGDAPPPDVSATDGPLADAPWTTPPA
jgi:hypothetical protein